MNENETQKTQIREANNRVRIEGVLKEVNLEEKDDVISGSVIIQTGKNSEHEVSVYISRLTKDKKENKAYKGMKTVMGEYVSIASLIKLGKTIEEAEVIATKVRVNNGKLGRNEFYVGEEFISRPRISSNFFTRVNESDGYEPKADFEVECYFDKIKKETKDSEETGRLIIEAIIPIYGGSVIPMEFVADEGVSDYIDTNYEPKRTGCIRGDIVNTVERVVTKKSGFGKDREEVKTNRKQELSITGGDESQYDEDSDKSYSTEHIQEAWKVRETEMMPELLKRSKDKQKSGSSSNVDKKTSGFNF